MISESEQNVTRSVFVVSFVIFLASIALGPLGQYAIRQLMRYRKPCNLPVLNLEGWQYNKATKEFTKDIQKYLKIGRDQHADSGYQLFGPEGYVVVLPEKVASDLKNLDDSIIDNSPLVLNITGGIKWVNVESKTVFHALQKDVFPRLALIVPAMMEEAEYALKKEFGDVGEDWTPIQISSRIPRVIAVVIGRVFVNRPLNRDDTWIKTSVSYTMDLTAAGKSIRDRSLLGKYIAAYINPIPEVHRVYEARALARRIFVPIITDRMNKQKQDPKYKLPNDMISWAIEESNLEDRPVPVEEQANSHLSLTFPAVHTQSMTMQNILYDLAVHPEYLAPLREEIESVWPLPGTKADKQVINQLNKMDSFLKESQRMHPLGLVGSKRRVNASNGITLSNGLHLPKHTLLAFPSSSISMDPKIWTTPEKFQPFRFSDLRKSQPEQAGRYHFVSIGPEMLHFGYGKHACPGRSLASNVLKIILGNMLKEYDIMAPEDWNGQRPANVQMIDTQVPNPMLKVMMRKRKT